MAIEALAEHRDIDVVALIAAAERSANELGQAAIDGSDEASWTPPRSGPGAGSQLVDLISRLAELTSAAAALQARAAVELDRARRAEEASRGVAAARRGHGVAAEVGLAAQTSAARGSTLLGFGKALCLEMPHTLHALARGRLSPWRAMLLVKESACLPIEDRARLDRDLCAHPAVLEGLGDRRVGDAARTWCARENAAAVVARQRKAESERRVSLRPAPDTMAYLTALLPVTEGVAAYAALTARADSARTAGDERTRGQVMADALVSRITGLAEGERPPVLVNLVMTDRALFTGETEPATLPGYGPVPAAWARDLVTRGSATGAPRRAAASSRRTLDATGSPQSSQGSTDAEESLAWIRRLYTAPGTGALVAMDSRRRQVPASLKEFITLRDGARCRIPWCDAPGRHVDHAVAVEHGGRTEADNLQLLCEADNYAKQAPGWHAAPAPVGGVSSTSPPSASRSSRPSGSAASSASPAAASRSSSPSGHAQRHQIVTDVPTGHTHHGTAPPLPGGSSPDLGTEATPRVDNRAPGLVKGSPPDVPDPRPYLPVMAPLAPGVARGSKLPAMQNGHGTMRNGHAEGSRRATRSRSARRGLRNGDSAVERRLAHLIRRT